METIIPPLLAALGIYLLLGFLFGIAFAFRGVKKIAPAAAEAGLGFKLLTIPGCTIFWPLLINRWAKQQKPPTEKGAHRS